MIFKVARLIEALKSENFVIIKTNGNSFEVDGQGHSQAELKGIAASFFKETLNH